MTHIADIPELVENLEWVARRFQTGPINLLLTAAADALADGYQTIRNQTCPNCGTHQPGWHHNRLQATLLAVQHSWQDNLIHPTDVGPLIAHALHQRNTT